jgi:hypothetical protein
MGHIRPDSWPSRFGYARLTTHQRRALLNTVRGKVVWDLGAGSGELACFMVRAAAHVHAVEKDGQCFEPVAPKLTYHRARFTDPEFMATLPAPDVIVTSWLVNNNQTVSELVRLLSDIGEHRPLTYVWIGINDDITACGGVDIQYFVRSREWANVREFSGTVYSDGSGASDLGVYTDVRTPKSPRPGCAPAPSLPLCEIR